MRLIFKMLKIALIVLVGSVIITFLTTPYIGKSDEEIHEELTRILDEEYLGYDAIRIDHTKKHQKSKSTEYRDIILYDNDREVKTTFTAAEHERTVAV